MVLGQLLASVTIADLEQLVVDATPENEQLEFKRDLPDAWNDDLRREILRDMTALANRSGGRLLFGVEENDDGEATAIVGIEGAVSKADRLVAIARDSVSRPLRVRTAIVSLDDGSARAVVIGEVPDSVERPHMITFRGGATDFWIRHDREKHRMTIDEIERAFEWRRLVGTQVDEAFVRARNNLARRWGRDESPIVWFAFAPLAASGARVDTRDGTTRQLIQFGQSEFEQFRAGVVVPSMDGVLVMDEEPAQFETRELWRNGLFAGFEHTGVDRQDDPPVIAAEMLARVADHVVNVAVRLYQRVGYSGPLAVQCGLLLVQGYALLVAQRRFDQRQFRAVDAKDIVPPAVVADAPVVEALNQAFKLLLDHIANGFHQEENRYFTAERGYIARQ